MAEKIRKSITNATFNKLQTDSIVHCFLIIQYLKSNGFYSNWEHFKICTS